MRLLALLTSLFLTTGVLIAQSLDPDTYGASFDLKTENPEELARALCKPFNSDRDKARVIFSWLANHLEYDLEEARRNRPIQIMYKSQEDLKRQIEDIRRKRMSRALRYRRGVCNHYASLFETMCRAVGLEAGEIEGYVARDPGRIIRTSIQSNHVWNWVRLNGRICLVDVTYAAGMADMTGQTFTMEYEPRWFDVAPRTLIQTHFPDEPADQRLPAPLTAEEFTDRPFFYPASARVPVLDWSPSGRDVSLTEEVITIQLAFRQKPRGVYLIVNNIAREVPTKWKGNTVQLDIPADLLKQQRQIDIGAE
jgi:hypothetical protein